MCRCKTSPFNDGEAQCSKDLTHFAHFSYDSQQQQSPEVRWLPAGGY